MADFREFLQEGAFPERKASYPQLRGGNGGGRRRGRADLHHPHAKGWSDHGIGLGSRFCPVRPALSTVLDDMLDVEVERRLQAQGAEPCTEEGAETMVYWLLSANTAIICTLFRPRLAVIGVALVTLLAPFMLAVRMGGDETPAWNKERRRGVRPRRLAEGR